MDRAFICHNSKDSKFVIEVCQYLKQNLDEIYYFEEHQRTSQPWVTSISKTIEEFEIFIAFMGNEISKWQEKEINTAIIFQNSKSARKYKRIISVLLKIDHLPREFAVLNQDPLIKCNEINDSSAYEIAKRIIFELGLHWKSKDGLPPVSNFFQYEKNIIQDYINLIELKDDLFKETILTSNNETVKTKELVDAKESLKIDLREKLIYGLPPVWPKVKKMPGFANYHKNTVSENIIGKFRQEDAKIVAAALTSFHPDTCGCLYKNQLTFPEAGPREFLFYPRENKSLKIAILVSGGIAPGINSVINGIVQRHELYAEKSKNPYTVEIYGLQNGFYAFDEYTKNLIRITSEDTSKVANESGSFIGTSRDDRLIETSPKKDQNRKVINQLLTDNIDILYIIGGDGSMRAAHALWNYTKEMIKETEYEDKHLSIIGIPKTMDNDILWVWQTFGFLSAVEKAREIIEQLSAEVVSNPRICVVQLFGSDSGFVVSHAVVASKSTVCDVALIPEVTFTMQGLANYLTKKIEGHRKERKIPMSLIVMAETAIPLDALDFIDDTQIDLTPDEKDSIRWFIINSPQFKLTEHEKTEIEKQIQTKQVISINKRNDNLRTAGLKIVSRGLKKLLPKDNSSEIAWKRLRIFTNEPRHILRTTSPSCSDTIMGNRLGTLAVDNALAGYSDFMISQWLTEFVMVPLKLVVLGKKRIPISGNFWKSVTTKTGQNDLNILKKRTIMSNKTNK